ncbi:hypothetical protein V8F06_000429 [Rhypophila decipiens]
MTSLPLGVISLSLLLIFFVHRYILFPAFFSPLASIPKAHWSAPFSRLWVLSVRWNRRENKTLLALHRRLGPVISFGPNEVSINTIDGVRTVYQGGFEKPAWYSVFDNYGVPCMFSLRKSNPHSLRKRLISRIYSKSYIQSSLAAKSQAQSIIYNRLLPILEESISSTQIPHGIDVYSLLTATAMDFISAYTFGLDGGTNFLQDKPYRDHFLEVYRARAESGFYDQELPVLTRFCRRIGIPLCPGWVDAANRELGEWCLGLLDNIIITTRSGGPSSPKDTAGGSGDKNKPVVYNALVTGLDKEEEGGISLPSTTNPAKHQQNKPTNRRLTLASELFDHVLAGHETAGIALSYTVWRLSQNPALQTKLRAELLAALSPNNMMLFQEKEMLLPDPKALDALPLLNALLTETLRLHAPLAGPQPRETPKSGCSIEGFYIPGGVRISASAYALHRDEEVYQDPERWDHTRWLPEPHTPLGSTTCVAEKEGKKDNAEEDENEADETLKEQQKRRQFWAFGSGGRMCIGSHFATHEMKLIISAIYSNYTTHIVDDEGMDEQSDGYTCRPGKERLFLRFEKV